MHRRIFARDDDDLNCGSGGGADTYTGLRIASVFIVLVGSMSGALFPVLTRRTRVLREFVPKSAFDVAKYFGSGVIIATAFIHLLDPAIDELSSLCLNPAWLEYPYALAICLASIFFMFIVELTAFRWGTAKLAKLGISTGGGHSHGPAATPLDAELAEPHQHIHQHHGIEHVHDSENEKGVDDSEVESLGKDQSPMDNPTTQILGVAILEFGVLLHSILIGLTLAVDPDFKVLFVVIIFHQTFEGLGVGTRLAYMQLPTAYNWVPVLGAMLYGITTPLGIAVGLGVRSSYNPNSTTASIVSGILDAFSSGILIYTGLVELLAHEFLFNREMMEGSTRRLVFSIGVMMLGAGLMALLGKWA